MVVKPAIIREPAKVPDVKIVNCCPHAVSIYTGCVFDENSGRSKGGWLQAEFPPSGKKAVVLSEILPLAPYNADGVPIPACTRKFKSITHLPVEAGTVYIVPSLYITAAAALGRSTSDLVAPNGEVVDSYGRKIGCTSLARCA